MDNASLDERVLTAIKAGQNTAGKLYAHLNQGLEYRDKDTISARQIDRSLQRLRRADRIFYTGQSPKDGWRVTVTQVSA